MSYAGYHLYKKVTATEIAQKALVETQNKERLTEEQKAANLITLQQQALTQAQAELAKTKTDAAKTSAQVKTLTKTLQDQSNAPKDIVITSSDLSPYVTGIVQVICKTGASASSGSGTLWNFKEGPHSIVTNYHVVKNSDNCAAIMTNSSNVPTGIFAIDGTIKSFNPSIDEAVLTIDSSVSSTSIPIANYNYSLGAVRKCPTLMPIGTPVVIMGFPAYAKRDSVLTVPTIGDINAIYRTATNGIVSGYDTSQGGDANYFVSAKIDNGNSGGMALAKDKDGLCLLGLPTWLTVGNYETQGLVQNIINVLPKN
jgi:hypothetical protein